MTNQAEEKMYRELVLPMVKETATMYRFEIKDQKGLGVIAIVYLVKEDFAQTPECITMVLSEGDNI